MNLVIIDALSTDSELFVNTMKQPATTVFFNNFTPSDVARFLKESGFEQLKYMKRFYCKKIDEFILIIKLETCHIKEKYLVNYTDDNLSYIMEGKEYDKSFESFHNDEQRNHTLYPEGVETPFFENFMVREHYGNPSLIRTDIGFKYFKNRFVIASLYEQHKNQIHICYDDYSQNPDCILADYIGFKGQELIDLKLRNTKNGSRLSLLEHQDTQNIFNVNDINLENFHLFWENYTDEQKTLLNMLLI